MYKNWFTGLEEMDRDEQIKAVVQVLKDSGATEYESGRGQNKVKYYGSSGYVLAVRRTPDPDSDTDFTIMDEADFDRLIVKADGTFNFNQRANGTYKVRVSYTEDRKYNMPLHQAVLKNEGFAEYRGADHIFTDPRINTREALRPATSGQNRANTRFLHKVFFKDAEGTQNSNVNYEDVEHRKYGSFAYNPLIDFSRVWFAYVACRMLGMLSWDELLDYNKDYIKRTDPDAVAYYQTSLA